MGDSSKTSQVPGQVAPTLSQGPASAPGSSRSDALFMGHTFGPGEGVTELTPPHVPGYDLIRELGRGGMGVVYLAREIALNRLVALKLMSSIGTAADLARFRAEAEAVAALRHPNIVQIYAIGDAGGRPFVALEFVEGGTLAQQLHGLPCNPHTAAALLVTLAETIHFAHNRGIVHRDLKPGNVLVSPSGVDVAAPLDSGLRRLHPHGLKIADFGLAKRMDQADSQTKTGLVMGTPEYMAPEQAAGRSRLIGPPADIYALGAVLYETLTGRPPHRGILPMDTLLQVLNDEPVRPSRLVPNLPRDLETICLKCLEKDPARRYATAHDLAADLRRFLKDQPIVARPLGRVGRAWRWCRRNRLAASGLAAAFLFFVLGSAASLTFGLLALNRAAEAEAARGAERDAKSRAERQYNLTRDTVDRLLPLALTLRASQDVNLGRKQALELAVEMYDKLLSEAPDDADLVAKATDLRLQLGLVFNDLQMPAEALPHLEAARRGFELLARREPANYHFRYQEASAAYNRGQSLRVLGRTREALEQMALAIARWQAMLVDLPAKDVPRTLENAHLLMTLVCLETDDVPGARMALSQAERFSTLPVEAWQMAAINELQRARRQALQARLELWDRRPTHAVRLLRQALQAWSLAEQESKQIQARSWEKLAMRVELARALALAGDFAAARQELADALQPSQEPTLAQTMFLNMALNRVRGLRLRARLEALDDPATAAATLADAEQLAGEMARASPESVLLGLERLRVLNDQLEGFAAPPTEAERERLRAAAIETLSHFEATADAAFLARERQRLQSATAPISEAAGTLGWTKWLPEESAMDVQLRHWSTRIEWSPADAGALDRLLAEQGERARTGERLARVNVAAALVLSAQRAPEHRVASLRQALAALTDLAAAAPESWELHVRLALTADLLADATGDADDRTRAAQWRSTLPPLAQRLLRRWPEPPSRRARPPTTIAP